MTELQKGELREILGAIREVEANLDKRAARAFSVVQMVWGVVAASIFAFYQAVHLNMEYWKDALGVFVNWVWAFPAAIGYLVTAWAGARVGRLPEDRTEARYFLRLVFLITPPMILSAYWSFTETHDYIPGMWILVLGVTVLVFPSHNRFYAAARILVSAASLLGGAYLLWQPHDWGHLIAAVYYGVGLIGLGAVRYECCE